MLPKLSLRLNFVLKNVEDGSCRYFYAQETNTVMDSSKLVCTPEDITNLRKNLQKKDIVDLCTRERDNNKRNFYNLTNLTIFQRYSKMYPWVVKVPYYLNCS